MKMYKILIVLCLILCGCGKQANKDDYFIVSYGVGYGASNTPSRDYYMVYLSAQNKIGEIQEDVHIEFYTLNHDSEEVLFYEKTTRFGANEIKYISDDITQYIDKNTGNLIMEHGIT